MFLLIAADVARYLQTALILFGCISLVSTIIVLAACALSSMISREKGED